MFFNWNGFQYQPFVGQIKRVNLIGIFRNEEKLKMLLHPFQTIMKMEEMKKLYIEFFVYEIWGNIDAM